MCHTFFLHLYHTSESFHNLDQCVIFHHHLSWKFNIVIVTIVIIVTITIVTIFSVIIATMTSTRCNLSTLLPESARPLANASQ